MKAKNTDLIGGLFMVITALFFWTKMDKFTPYAKIFPKAIIILVFLSGIGLLIKSITNGANSELFVLDDKAKMILVAAISLAWVLLFKKIGFVVTSFLALGILIWVLGEKKSLKNFIMSFLIAGGEIGLLYYAFSKVLYVPFPKGFFF